MKTLFLSAAALALILSVQPARAHDAPEVKRTLSAEQTAEIEAIIHDYIMAHPDVMIKSFDEHRVTQEKMAEEAATTAAKDLLSNLEKDGHPSVGAKEPDLVVVEFMDYNCGYCKKAYEEVRAVLDEDKKIKFYFIDMPILGPTSYEASKWAMAAHKQGKYFEFHSALMKHQGPKDESVLESKAKEAGLDVKKAQADKEDPSVAKLLEDNLKAAEQLNITGTPGFIVGEEIVRGYMTLDQLKEKIAENRKK